MRRSCHELTASLAAGTPSLSVWPLLFYGKPLHGGSCQQAAKASYCPYLELLSLKLYLLLQNMFILVSSPSWLPDQCEPREQQLRLSDLGQARQGKEGNKTLEKGRRRSWFPFPNVCQMGWIPSHWGIAVDPGEQVAIQNAPLLRLTSA